MWRCSSASTFSIPARKAREQLALGEVARDEVLPRLRQRRLDDAVVERHRRRQARDRRVATQLVAGRLEAAEDPLEAPVQPGPDLLERTVYPAVSDPGDLVHEAIEEDGVPGLVGLLGGKEVLLLFQRRGVDVGREAVDDRVLAPEEQRVVP